MKNALFTVVFVLAAVVAYDWYQDSRYTRLQKPSQYATLLHGDDEGLYVPLVTPTPSPTPSIYREFEYNMPIEPIINEPAPDPGPPEYEETYNGVTTKVWKGQTISIPPAVTPTPIWETCRIEDTKIHWPTKRIMGSLKVDNSCTFRSGGKEFKLKWDDEADVWWIAEVDDDSTINSQNWPDCGLIPRTGWYINLCVGDEVIYTFR